MKIGRLNLQNNIFLAPMAGITDIPFRTLCKEQGCGLVYTEMVSAKGLVRNDRKSWILADIVESERPAGVQIFGADPSVMAEAASMLCETDRKCDLIDINMGCPVAKVVKSGEGSSLMRTPELVGRIVRAVADAAGDVPVTVKIRKGWDMENVNAVEVALIAEANGAAAVAVHGRTRDQFYGGVADRDVIRQVKKALKVPVIGSGDIFTKADADSMFAETGCDAIMVARGALGDPWIFAELLGNLAPGTVIAPAVRRELILRHFAMLVELKGPRTGTLEMRKHAAWYTKGMRGSAAFRTRLYTAADVSEMKQAINAVFQ